MPFSVDCRYLSYPIELVPLKNKSRADIENKSRADIENKSRTDFENKSRTDFDYSWCMTGPRSVPLNDDRMTLINTRGVDALVQSRMHYMPTSHLRETSQSQFKFKGVVQISISIRISD
jgi:hypothetical protein